MSYIKLEDAVQDVGAAIMAVCFRNENASPAHFANAATQALRSLPTDDGVTDEMVERAARALCKNMTLTEESWHQFTGLARAALEAALGPLPAPPAC